MQMAEHMGTQGVQDALPDPGHKDELEIVGPEVDQGNAQESQAHQMQARHIPGIDALIDAQHNQQGDAGVGNGIDEDRQQAFDHIRLERPHIGNEAQHDPVVIDRAQFVLVAEVVEVDGADAAGLQAAHSAHHAAETAAKAAAAHQLSPPSAPAAAAAAAGAGMLPTAASSSTSSCGRNCNS